MIDAYVISNLQESLGLTDDQFAKLVPLVKRLQTERREAMRTRMKTLHEMRRLLESGSATEAQVVERLATLKGLETEEPRRGQQTMEAIDAQLSLLQQAKFRVFEAEVGLKVRELMGQMRGERRPPGARRERKDAPPQ
jgi:Spy/CpxP family protein refolding chaperone